MPENKDADFVGDFEAKINNELVATLGLLSPRPELHHKAFRRAGVQGQPGRAGGNTGRDPRCPPRRKGPDGCHFKRALKTIMTGRSSAAATSTRSRTGPLKGREIDSALHLHLLCEGGTAQATRTYRLIREGMEVPGQEGTLQRSGWSAVDSRSRRIRSSMSQASFQR